MVAALFGINLVLNIASWVDVQGSVDAQWAAPINTIALILLALVNYWTAKRAIRKASEANQNAEDAKRKVGANRREEDPE